MSRIAVYLFLLLTVPLACTPADDPAVHVSFYYWKTKFLLTANEQATLHDNNVTKLYVRYFDIALRNEVPVPLSPITFAQKPLQTVVPVVYIKNEVMMQQALDVGLLADKVVTLVTEISESNKVVWREIQLDCDWTLSSKDVYFRFIAAVKRRSGKILSVTIRLHQIKYYASTGLPDADRGVLMYYNMGHIAPDSSNSIYDRQTAHRYIVSLKKYPLPLDVALPIFRWGLHIRDNRVIALLNKTDESTYNRDGKFDMKASPFFEVRENVIKLGSYFEQGDRIKLETIQPEDLEEMADDLHEALPAAPEEIIFYDLDDFNLRYYQHEDHFFQKISRTF